MTLDHFRIDDQAQSGHDASSVESRLTSGQNYAISFGGQGGPWLASLAELVADADLSREISATVNQAATLLTPVADHLAAAGGDAFAPLEWIAALEAEEPVPTDAALAAAELSLPGILLAQLAATANLAKQGLNPVTLPPSAVIGHSQGLLAVEALATAGHSSELTSAQLLALAQLMGAAAALTARRLGFAGSASHSVAGRAAMVSVTGAHRADLDAALTEYVATRESAHGLPVVAIVNSRRSVVLSGAPRHLAGFMALCDEYTQAQAAERKAKTTGGTPFAPAFDELAVTAPFHHPDLLPAVNLVADWARACGIDPTIARELAARVLVEPVDWIAQIEEVIASGATWLIDFGPADLGARLAAPLVRGQGVGVIAAATRRGQRELFVPGSAPQVARRWSDFAPSLVSLPTGRTAVDTAFTRLTGRSPMLLAGMTPTTVDPAIVAAAANAGHWAELAGGGQVTEEIFAENLAKLTELLDDNRQAQFNSLFLDPYLWKLQLGGKRIVQKARAQGAPLDGVIVTAGIPELDEAVALVAELTEAGLHYVAFKPGTIDQIRAVLRIAAEVPQHPVIVQIEGGRAGGHHSWEDLDDLLLATYPELRERANIVICVGGGIGTPARASEYLTGAWSTAHGYPAMPLDGILIGTAAMATAEATTSPEVKQLLVDTVGCDQWIGAGHVAAGMASGRSQLGADIHEIDNSASRCGRLLDEVAGDAEAVEKRRDEIIAVMAATAKPYFGDVATMTYLEWLARYVELAVGDALPSGDSGVWADITWEVRFVELLRRAEARLHALDSGEFESMFADSIADPFAALDALAEAFPEASTDILHPADVAFFLEQCRTPGKPVNFVPVIDKDVRRWWRSDSLWQAHDPRYRADEVCIIPGPVAVAGITELNEPVGDLLNRFEAQVVADLRTAGTEPQVVAARRRRGIVPESGPLSVLIEADDVLWAGRQVRNPIALLGDRGAWTVRDGESAEHPSGAVITYMPDAESADDAIRLDLVVGVSGSELRIPFIGDLKVVDGGSPRVSVQGAADAMRELLTVAAGGALVGASGTALVGASGTAITSTVAFRAESIADHSGVTAAGLPSGYAATLPSSPNGFAVPDTLVVACWPTVFSVLGAAHTADGVPVVEGLLDLVHLDHAITLVNPVPTVDTDLTVTAQCLGVSDAAVGRVVDVAVTVLDGESVIAELRERFAIRGRLGAAELTDPERAGGALTDERTGTRKHLRSVSVLAPQKMNGFAVVSGDRNPIHTDAIAAKLAGLGDPIVHGMWLSAAAQQIVVAADQSAPVPAPRAIRGWTARYLGMVRLGDQVDVRVDRVGIDAGRDVIEVTAKVGGELVMAATGLLDAPRTVYAFPGQGIQSKGMGLDARSRCPAAREVWDRADKHTRTALGFSILAVVRDNPTTLVAAGERYYHPDGVLFLTQFTQVAMATLGVAQVAELREAGAFVEGSITCGHSVGEYNALAACAGVLPLEAVLEVVFQRGSAMHHLVPRDENGRSDYRLAAIRPSQFALDDADVEAFVGDIAAESGEFLEVVNLNLLGSQYAIAGTVRGLELLETEIDRRRAEVGGKRAFIVIPGIDVPFHSTVLRAGVPEFRSKLDELLPETFDPAILIGNYIPNLVPRLFSLDRDFVQEIADLVPSAPLDAVLADWDSWAERDADLARVVLIELLAWQFASPVRWIETQDLLFSPVDQGGLGVDRFVEVGVKSAPTLTGLARNTLKLAPYCAAVTEVVNVETDEKLLRGEDSAPEPLDEIEESAPTEQTEAPAAVATAVVAAPVAAAVAGPRPADIAFGPADAVRAVISLWTKMTPGQIGAADTIESLCDGVSSRRNQLLLDIGGELGLGAIDGAAEADMTALATTVDTLARGYKPFGDVLSDAVGDQVRKIAGPVGKRQNYITDRVADAWQLDAGWAKHTLVALALGSRDGASVRGGDLGDLLEGGVGSASDLDALIDRAVRSVGAARGIAVEMPAAATGGGGAVDSAALDALAETVTGPDGVLASTAQALLSALGLADVSTAADVQDDPNAIAAQRISDELGADWVRTVTPAFDADRAVLIDDRWASAREDLARIWLLADDAVDADHDRFVARLAGTGETVAAHATWWQGKALHRGFRVHARVYAAIAEAAQAGTVGQFAADVAVVTGASPDSIAAGVVGELLGGGATVIATTSHLTSERVSFYTELYREHASFGASLWVVPANLASYVDVDGVVEWIGTEQTENLGATTGVIKPALTPTLLFPFAAPRVAGDLTDAGGRAEMEMRVLLWSVERMIGGLAAIGADHNLASRLHVVLPGSPNRGMFGGDGAYGESKAALDALVTRWGAEESWGSRTTLAHALIGWVRGTGLMGANDVMVDAVEAAGVRTWSTAEMATELVGLCTADQRAKALEAPLVADLTAGLDPTTIDLKALAKQAADARGAEVHAAADSIDESAATLVAALPAPARAELPTQIAWPEISARPEDLVVIVGAGEVGPYGSSRTRFEMEVDERLSAAGVLELAWNTGLVRWEETPKPGWYDVESGDPVAEAEIAERYHDAVVERCGIRRYSDEGAMVDNTSPLLESVFLDEDLTFTVASELAARTFAAADPERTRIRQTDSGDWSVTRLAGTEIRVPRRFELSRSVGGQIPTGFDPVRWGVSADMAESVDRVALWNLVATVDAFLTAGLTPSELMRWVHPGLVANTQGTGMGGMTSMRSLYVDTLLGESKANDILQEALPNVVAAHVVQSYIGSYGAMIHPVAACATAAVSVEEGADKIRLGKALFAVAGGFDDLGIEGIVGFGDMSATADTEAMRAKGIDDRRFSRANDRRRGGFVESAGGGTILLARGDVAAQLGLPVLGVVAWAQSFGDGVHTSIPAPGLGALGAARGAGASPFAASLASLGVTPDEVAVVSKHDTSTRANDPNESELHERLANAIGRSEGAPLFVVSQKSLTGHAKGGAAAFQLIGLCQVLRDGVIPPNRSLDCVDEKMGEYPHLVWAREPLRMGDRFPLKAGVLTSLGFGHVSGLIAVVHPEAFVASLEESGRADYRRAAAVRLRDGRHRLLSAMCGGEPAYTRPADRRLGDGDEHTAEAALLLDPQVRLGADGAYA